MRYCVNCGAVNDNDAKFCSGCGTKFQEIPSGQDAPDYSQSKTADAWDTYQSSDTDTSQSSYDSSYSSYQSNTGGNYDAGSAGGFAAAGGAAAGSGYYQSGTNSYNQSSTSSYNQNGTSSYNQSSYTYQSDEGITERKYNGLSIASMVLGICSIVFSWLIPILPLAAAIVGLVLGNKAKKYGDNGMAKAGRITSIIGIVLVVLMFVLLIIGVAIFSTALIDNPDFINNLDYYYNFID